MYIIGNRIGVAIGAINVINMNSLEIIDFTVFGNKVEGGSATVLVEDVGALACNALAEYVN